MQPLAYVLQADAGAGALHVEAFAIVGDGDRHAVIDRPCADPDRAAGGARLQAVLDRIFHQRLQHHRRQLCAAQVVGHVDLHGQALAHADLEDFQVGEGAFEFVAQRRLFVLRARQ